MEFGQYIDLNSNIKYYMRPHN
ncbi:hypothetical protein M6B38_232180 [Iris pallida]|uniref:Maturase K n=1 Tax=Iris pallida TaxID=29817 RepID=A0AAX6DRF0_IRIPA|nr:hypothetical protein M6B38_232180 [Iris pallida]